MQSLVRSSLAVLCVLGLGSGAAVPSAHAAMPTLKGYYDGHLDTWLSTDVSDKAQAAMMHINYAPVLATTVPKGTSPMYMVTMDMRALPVVFGSEPGKPDYSPLWQEVLVHWKAGATHVTLTGDDQIKGLAKKGQLTMTFTTIVLNGPITVVAKS